ncbi:hypothetical protein AALP_AAs47930U000100 [Arabis alpina]|uniref:Retrotransposon gag domain-containing protein n=1 Tax=Arabis alpina TaxID=50452 RepID=A0A087FX35_ARAAL|nr:hypothetical protein AALP_AAs47930U000100 [Arabis alpina]
MWIYGTVSEQVLDTILKAKSTARDIWLILENLFRDNKEAQALQYDNELRTLEIGDLSITDYTHKLKSLFDLLANLDSPISERALVMHMLNGLSEKFDSIINVIQHQTPFPSFTKARSMLLMEEKRLLKQVKPAPQHNTTASSPTVLYTDAADHSSHRSQSTNDDGHASMNNYNTGSSYNRGRGRGRGGRNSRGGRGRNNYNNNYHNNNQWPPQQSYSPPPWTYNSAPWPQPPQHYGVPLAYSYPPTYPPPPQPMYTSPYHSPASGLLGPSPHRSHGEAHMLQHAPPASTAGSSNTYLPSALSHAFSTMSVQDPSDQTWYMDTGASNHIATTPGSANSDQAAPV